MKTKTLTSTRKNLSLLLVAASMALSIGSANAAVLTGTTVQFSFDDSLLDSLFGTFLVNGDNLEFSPHNFAAQTNNNLFGTANATTPLITVSAKSGYVLSGVSLFEQGDYYRIESAPNTSFVGVSGQFIVNNNPTSILVDQPAAGADVHASLVGGGPSARAAERLRLRSNAVGGGEVAGIQQVIANNALSTALRFNDLANNSVPFATTAWTVSETVALNAAESATVKVQNVLVAGALPNVSTAFIEKKLVSIGAFTTPVPVPAAFWTFGSALLCGLLVGRRKQLA